MHLATAHMSRQVVSNQAQYLIKQTVCLCSQAALQDAAASAPAKTNAQLAAGSAPAKTNAQLAAGSHAHEHTRRARLVHQHPVGGHAVLHGGGALRLQLRRVAQHGAAAVGRGRRPRQGDRAAVGAHQRRRGGARRAPAPPWRPHPARWACCGPPAAAVQKASADVWGCSG